MFLIIRGSPLTGGGGDRGSAVCVAYWMAFGASATLSIPREGRVIDGARNPEVLGENMPAPESGASRTNTRVWTSGSQLLTLRGNARGRPDVGSTDWNFCRNGNGRGDKLRLGDRFPLSLVVGRIVPEDGIERQPIVGACDKPLKGG